MRAALFGTLVALCTSGAFAETTTLTLGTATPGGGFAVYGQAVADRIAVTDPSLRIELRPTRGSGENVPLLEAGKLDLALIEGTIAHDVVGDGSKVARLPVVAAMYPSAGMFVVRADSPYRKVLDLKGHRVVFGASSSGLVVLARYVLDGLDLDMRKDFDAVLLESAKDGPPQVLDNSAAALWGGGLGWPGFEAVAKSAQGGRFIGLEAADIARIRAKHPFLKQLTVPAGSYTGLDRDLATVGTWSMILARPGLPDEAVQRFVRALYGADPTGKSSVQLRETTVENTRDAVPDMRVLHPGARRYIEDATGKKESR